MFTCKQVANNLNEQDYKKLPFFRRLFLKLHVRLCVVCGRYQRRVMKFQDGVRCYHEADDAGKTVPQGDLRLGSTEKEALAEALREAVGSSSGPEKPGSGDSQS